MKPTLLLIGIWLLIWIISLVCIALIDESCLEDAPRGCMIFSMIIATSVTLIIGGIIL